MTSKTRPRNGWTLAVALLLAAPALAQPDSRRDEEARIPPEERSTPVFSLNISSELLINGINRLVEKRLTKDYGFDEYQAEEMRLLLNEVLPRFLEEYQAELEVIATEWLEAVSGDEPPTAERAADWAARLRPILEEAEVMVDQVSDGMREFLNDDQQVLLDGFQEGIKVAARSAKGRLYEFEQGHFDPEKHWPGSRAARRRSPKEVKAIRRQMEVARQDAMSGNLEPIARPARPETPPDRAARQAARSTGEHALAEDESPAAAQPDQKQSETAAAPADTKAAEKKDEWALYIEAFIKRYQLDDEQQQKARHFLERAHAGRDRYFAGKGSEMERITGMFKNAKDAKQRATVQKKYDYFQKPLDGMFERLKRDLDKLPTRAQRRAAAQSQTKLPDPGTPAKKAPGDGKSP